MNNNEWNNQSNISNNQVNPKKKNNVKLLVTIIGGMIVLGIVIFAVLKIFNISSVISTHKNTTGLSEYSGLDVDYNCVYEYTKNNDKMKEYSDIIFNYKSDRKDGKQNNYQVKVYSKMILEYGNGLTNSKYKEVIDSFNSLECVSLNEDNKCTGDHLELGITESGWNTVVDRIGNKIEITYYNIYGLGQTATEKDKNELIEQYKNKGYICN